MAILQVNDINEKLTEASLLAQHSTASDVYDEITSELTEQLEELNTEFSELSNNKYQVTMMQKKFDWLIEQLETMPEYVPITEQIPFRDDVFKLLVNRCECQDNGKKNDVVITYTFIIGVTWKALGNKNPHKKMMSEFIETDNSN